MLLIQILNKSADQEAIGLPGGSSKRPAKPGTTPRRRLGVA